MLLPIKECGKGVNKDIAASELAPGMWSDALNMEFDGITFRRRNGIQSVYTTPTAIPYYLLTYSKSGTVRYLIQAGTATVFVDDGTTRTNVTPVSVPTGARTDRWSGGVLNGVPILNNGVNNPVYWNGDTTSKFLTLGGWNSGDTVATLRPFSYYLVGLGYTPSGGTLKPYRVRWSSAADPGSLPSYWAASATNDAGEQDITEAGVLVDCLPLGGVNIIYGKEGRYAMEYIGGTSVFSFKPLPGKDGLFNRGCVVATPKGHVFMTNGDVMIHQGGEATSIVQGRMRTWLFSTIDSSTAQNAFLAANPQKSEVWVCFPSTGVSDCDKAAVWNWNADTWSIYSLPNVAYGTSGLVASGLSSSSFDSDTASFDSDVTTFDQDEYNANEARLILSTSTPALGLANTGATDFGADVSQLLERKGIKPADSDDMLILQRSRWSCTGTVGAVMTIFHGVHTKVDDSPTYASTATYTHGTTDWLTRMTKRGHYMAIKMTSTSASSMPGRSVSLEYVPAGRWA